MKKKWILLGIFSAIFFITGVTLAGVPGDLAKLAAPAKMVKIEATLPNAIVLTAVVTEGGTLSVTIGEEEYQFAAVIIDPEEKIVDMVNIYASSHDALELFYFEVIDIFDMPLQDMRQRKDCDDGTCCVVCGSTTACAQCVKMCNKSCCCRLACCVKL